MEIVDLTAVKLVIWDLDDTFWAGTIAEPPIEYDPDNHQLVIDLAERGVLSSICSNNDLAPVQALLEEKGLWNHFVFPEIDWTPKGPRIRRQIERAQLRAANVLFVDDRWANLDEGVYFNPGLMTLHVSELPSLRRRIRALAPSDPQLSRLREYRMLERKVQELDDAREHGDDLRQFLKRSGITVALLDRCDTYFERIHEMVHRTNQLNFTKLRSSRAELRALLDDPSATCRVVSVQDRYGDYGIVGFYAQRGDELLHFLFSCRILNMGIEQWLYEHLQRPRLPGAEMPAALGFAHPPDWIKHVEVAYRELPWFSRILLDGLVRTGLMTPVQRLHARWRERKAAAATILLRGGCGAHPIAAYFEKRLGPALIETGELRASMTGMRLGRDDRKAARDIVRWTLDGELGSAFAEGRHTLYIVDLSRDYQCALYRYRDAPHVLVPLAPMEIDLTDPSRWHLPAEWYEHMTRTGAGGSWYIPSYGREGLAWLREHGTMLSRDERRDEIVAHVRWLIDNKPAQAALIFIDPVTVEYADIAPVWAGVPAESRILSALVHDAARNAPNVDIVSTRTKVTSRAHIRDGNPMHFVRPVYHWIATEIERRAPRITLVPGAGTSHPSRTSMQDPSTSGVGSP